MIEMARISEITRKTRETDISLSLDLNGSGRADVMVDDYFLGHMLETLARYASFDIDLRASGEDIHHLVEDVSIVIGIALRQAMGETPVERTGFRTLPMDDALVTVALDLIDRPFAEVDCPDALWHHFLRSLAMSSGMTLHVMVLRGFDDHHIIEATIKALGLALRQALIPRGTLLSTKDSPDIGGA